MAILGRLNTGDRLATFGINGVSNCQFCTHNGEDHQHLFFQCPFTLRVWTVIQDKCQVNWQNIPWSDLPQVVAADCKGKSLATIIHRLSFCSSVYHIWLERNNRIFSHERKPEEVVVKGIVSLVRYRLLAISNITRTQTDEWFLKEWRLPTSILK